jgi:broad specificity phosphatase PhoE
MSETKTIVLTVVRHGQTDANKKRLVQGFIDTPLNEFGEKQAETAGKALKDVIFHQVYSSDLKRAHRTCQHILEQNKVSKISSSDIVQDDRLREQNFGIHENLPIDKWVEMAIKADVFMYDLPL